MTLYVLQIVGNDASEIAEQVLAITGPPKGVRVAVNDAVGPNFVDAITDWRSTIRELSDGTAAAALARPSNSGVRSAILLAPCTYGARLSHWLATIECENIDWRNVWSSLSVKDSTLARILCIDDGLELSDDLLSVTQFPWGESRIVIAAIRREDGTWVVRENASPRW